MLAFKKKRTALIDADMVAYRVAGMVEKDNGDVQDCEDMVPAVVSTWAKEASCSDIVICKGTKSFRHSVYPEYKAHRKDKPKPKFLKVVRNIIDNLDYPQKRVNGLEADDIQGILATTDRDKYVIVNNDKDMLTIGGVLVYNPDKMDFPEYTSWDVASRNLWTQILTGDPTDNYKGIPGCGPVKAAKILDETVFVHDDDPDPAAGTYAGKVRDAYRKANLSDEYLLQMCQCAKILTADLWDKDNKTFKLWNPYKYEEQDNDSF